MSYFLRNGNTFRVSDELSIDLHKKLPKGNYVVKVDTFGNFYLEIVDEFIKPAKLYGNTQKVTERVISTFMSRTVSTGVLLAGEKGSGKTLLARNLSLACFDMEIPCVIVNTAFSGDGFNKLIQDIEQPCMVLFDEFEKVYDEESQQHILTLLDGVFPSKKLFVLTCNDKYRIDTNMRNRPGRIFYNLDFKGLSSEFVREYCEDNLTNKKHIDNICNLITVFNAFNFDMLKALVEEMNRYDESPQEVLNYLNIRPEYSQNFVFDVELEILNKDIVQTSIQKTWKGNPLEDHVHIEYCSIGTEKNKDEEVDNIWDHEMFSPSDIKKLSNGKIIFVNSEGSKLTLTKKEKEELSFYRYADF